MGEKKRKKEREKERVADKHISLSFDLSSHILFRRTKSVKRTFGLLNPGILKPKSDTQKETDVSIISAPPTAADADTHAEMKNILDLIHPIRPPESQLQGLQSLEILSLDPSTHSMIHEPSVIQSLFFFIRVPPTQMKTIHFLLVTNAASILANVCITFPKLADDLLHLGIYTEIVKILTEVLPLPVDRPLDLEKANAVDKLFALLVNLQAKRSSKLLPYMAEEDDEKSSYFLDEAMNLAIHFTQMTSHEATRSVCLFLRNLLQDSRAHRQFLSSTKHLQFVLHAFYDVSQQTHCAVSDAAVGDWMSVISFLVWNCDELRDILLEYHTPDCVMIVLQSRRPLSLSLQLECARALSFLSSNEEVCDHLLTNTNVVTVVTELLLSFDANGSGGIALSRPKGSLGGSDSSFVMDGNMSFKEGRGSGSLHSGNQSRFREDSEFSFLKFTVNLIANLTFGSPEKLTDLFTNDQLILKIASLLEEGDRFPPFIQIKLVTILHNIMMTKEGRKRVAGFPKMKDVFRSQMSSTNKTLRDIVSRCLTELRDEKKSTDEDRGRRESKMRGKRGRVMEELIQTERTYVDNLLQMVALFLRFKVISQESKHNKVDVENASRLHADVEALSSLHFKFFQELEKCVKKEEAWECDDDRNTIGRVINDYLVGKMDVYRDYTQNFEKYQTFTETKSFRKFLETERKSESKQQKKRVTVTPQSLLITPIQRIPRYVLLLEELLDVTSPDDHDYENIASSFEVTLRNVMKCSIN